MRVLMLVITGVVTDTRVLREATALAEAGHSVHVIGKDVPDDFVPPDGVSVSSVGAGSVFRKEGSKSLGARRKLPPHIRVARWILLPQHRNSAFKSWRAKAYELAEKTEFDVVHAHDFNTLELGAKLAEERKVPLVYDTHEMWSGRPRIGRPTPLQHKKELQQEQELGSKATTVITVGEGVAGALGQRFGWKNVEVVRNTFPRPENPPPVPEKPTGVVYAGRIAPYRELETIAAAAKQIRPLTTTIVGPADETYLGGFRPQGVDVRPPLPVDSVDQLYQEKGIALITHSDKWMNHRLAMPNKLFHAVRAGVPVVATDVSELRRIVEAHGLGALYRAGDPVSFAAAVRQVADRYGTYVTQVAEAAGVLSWEHDAEVLRGLYERLG